MKGIWESLEVKSFEFFAQGIEDSRHGGVGNGMPGGIGNDRRIEIEIDLGRILDHGSGLVPR